MRLLALAFFGLTVFSGVSAHACDGQGRDGATAKCLPSNPNNNKIEMIISKGEAEELLGKFGKDFLDQSEGKYTVTKTAENPSREANIHFVFLRTSKRDSQELLQLTIVHHREDSTPDSSWYYRGLDFVRKNLSNWQE